MFDDEAQRKARQRREERRRRSPEQQAREHPVRVTILAMLSRDGEGLTAEQVRGRLPVDRSRAAVAYHLAVLRGVGLVRAKGSSPARRFTRA